jgi:hypothetical protein
MNLKIAAYIGNHHLRYTPVGGGAYPRTQKGRNVQGLRSVR